MKIGLLTFHKPINYGAYLQAFSLSHNLSAQFPGDTVEIIDYVAPKEKNKIVTNVLRSVKYFGLLDGIKDIQKILSFRRVYRHLPLGKAPAAATLDQLFRHIDRTYDVLVIGSDAIFNWNQNGYPTAFIPHFHFKHCKVVSYAASVHGLNYLQEPTDRLTACGHTFDRMSIIGTRDQNTEHFVKTCSAQATATHCCDPTCVIDVDRIRELAGNYPAKIASRYGCQLDKPYIVLMMPDSPFTEALRARYAEQYQIITLFRPSKAADFYLHALTPFEWATVLGGACAVVTSYFHGTLLALRQGVPVISVDLSNYNDAPYEGKLKDLLLRRLDLPDFYVSGPQTDDEAVRQAVFHTLDRALTGEYHAKILSGMQAEAEAFSGFIDLFNQKIRR